MLGTATTAFAQMVDPYSGMVIDMMPYDIDVVPVMDVIPMDMMYMDPMMPMVDPMMMGPMMPPMGPMGPPMGPMMGPGVMPPGAVPPMQTAPQIPPPMPNVAPPALGPVTGPTGMTEVPPQIPPLTVEMVEKDTEEIKAAIAGLGTDEKTLVRILTTRSPAQMEQIRATYDAKFGSLVKEVDSDTSMNYGNVILSCIFHRWEFEAHWLRRAINGLVIIFL